MSDVPAFMMGQSQFIALQLTDEFLRGADVYGRALDVPRTAPSAETTVFFGGFLRVLAWNRTLAKLNEPSDFQAETVATRAFLEIAVDVILMHFDAPRFPSLRLLAWDDSARLGAAMRIRDFFQRRKETPAPEYAAQMAFISREEKRIRDLRVQHWNGKHPARWTGRGRNLEIDARDAGQLFPEARLEEFYDTRYQQACWNTHGSGIAGFANVPADHIPALSALALRECVQLSLVISEVVLRQLGLWDAAMAVRFDDHRKNVLLLAYAAMKGELRPDL